MRELFQSVSSKVLFALEDAQVLALRSDSCDYTVQIRHIAHIVQVQ
jgi:hypothetical protein